MHEIFSSCSLSALYVSKSVELCLQADIALRRESRLKNRSRRGLRHSCASVIPDNCQIYWKLFWWIWNEFGGVLPRISCIFCNSVPKSQLWKELTNMRCAPTWSEMRTIFSQPLQSLVEYLPHAWVELLEAFFLEICLDMKNIVSCSIIILLQYAEVRLSYFDFCSHSVCLVSSQ